MGVGTYGLGFKVMGVGIYGLGFKVMGLRLCVCIKALILRSSLVGSCETLSNFVVFY